MSDDKNTERDYPSPPDLERVRTMRRQLRADQAARDESRSPLGWKVGRRASDIGTYTLIPSLMVAGPAVGYGLGYWVERSFGGAPWGVVGGMLLGLVAAFRQIFLLLKKKEQP